MMRTLQLLLGIAALVVLPAAVFSLAASLLLYLVVRL
jgi:hypothetical protein